MDMIQASRVKQETGEYVEALVLVKNGDLYFNLLGEEVNIDETIVFEPVPGRIYKPIYDFQTKTWKEGLSPEEIEEIENRKGLPTMSEQMALLGTEVAQLKIELMRLKGGE
ncbi:hypothetical protein [Paenibacillus larvae]|uniref:hypothetical protein n=1 Tax=Paenibacillus larvae TaxID=1464 RepID=UPI000627F4B9|nr:hypothetical protein [Paenibacillus larvae]